MAAYEALMQEAAPDPAAMLAQQGHFTATPFATILSGAAIALRTAKAPRMALVRQATNGSLASTT